MPTYVYRCDTCGNEHDLIYPMGTAPDTLEHNDLWVTCAGLLKRVFLPTAVSFKGSGFYSTDSRTRHINRKLKIGGKDESNTSQIPVR